MRMTVFDLSRKMPGSVAELYDIDVRNDPLLAEYERARDLLQGTEWSQGLDDMEALAHRGSMMGTLLVADALLHGWMYDQDLPRAESWFEVAVAWGSARGLFGLGLTHLLMDRFSEAIQELEAAITRNFPPAYNALAGIYARGDGVPVDRQRALQLWRKGAALGHLPAKRNLLRALVQGRYGFWGRVEGFLNVVPVAFEIVRVRNTNRYTDRLR